MLNQRHAAAHKVAAHLFPTEESLQDTISDNLRLQLAIVEARRESGVRKNLGSDALLHLAESGRALASAWQSLLAAHASLHDDQLKAGLSAFNYGDNDQTPKFSEPAGELQPLRVAC